MENWKLIKFNPDYLISDLGNVHHFSLGKVNFEPYGLYLGVRFYYEGMFRIFSVHQLVAIAFHNHIPCGHRIVINHKDFNKHNNNKDNLELISQRENSNKKHIESSSKYVGVGFIEKSKKWKSRIVFKGKRVHLGTFKNEIDAHNAYQNALKQILEIEKQLQNKK